MPHTLITESLLAEVMWRQVHNQSCHVLQAHVGLYLKLGFDSVCSKVHKIHKAQNIVIASYKMDMPVSLLDQCVQVRPEWATQIRD
eukprot:2692055-Amphidinium_carterae.1